MGAAGALLAAPEAFRLGSGIHFSRKPESRLWEAGAFSNVGDLIVLK
jgi:hypothetical protein